MPKHASFVTGATAVLLLFATLIWAGTLSQKNGNSLPRSPVVVELFTSEGCSSCPSADQMLNRLESEQLIDGVEIIALEEHVDYWNHDGWTDPFSSQEWTFRQQEYDQRFKNNGPFTPELVVDGHADCSGNAIEKAQKAIQEAAGSDKVQVTITKNGQVSGKGVSIALQVGPIPASGEQSKFDLWLAVTEKGLHTAVKAGENNGREWQHAPVLRSLQKIGSIPSKPQTQFAANHQVALGSAWKKENLRIVAFVQDHRTGKIFGAATTEVLESTTR